MEVFSALRFRGNGIRLRAGDSTTSECGDTLPEPAVYSIAPAVDGSGNLYVGGYFTNYNGSHSNFILRLHSNGILDKGFAINNGFNGSVFTIAPALDGSGNIYVGGAFTDYNNISSNRIIRLDRYGSVDTNFDVGSGFSDDFLSVHSIVPTKDGSGDIYVGGAFSTYNGTASNRIIRLNSNGSRDDGFAIGTGFGGSSSRFSDVRSIALATDGSGDIYVGGWFTNFNGTASNRIIRLNQDGSRDPGFAVGDGFSSRVFSVASTTDGSGDIYVGGWFTFYQIHASGRVVRLNSDGSVDTGFDVDRGFNSESSLNSGIATIHSIVPANDGTGTVYIGGNFDNYQSEPVKYLVRLNSDGTLDRSFVTYGYGNEVGFNDEIRSIALATNGSGNTYVGGRFTSFFGSPGNRIIRLNSDGSRDTGFVIGNGIGGCRPVYI